MYQRFASERLGEALLDTPVVLLAGARQVGKSTLARAAALREPNEPIFINTKASRAGSSVSGRYVTFDDATLAFGPNLIAAPIASLWEKPL